jgi:hypothetical protein
MKKQSWDSLVLVLLVIVVLAGGIFLIYRHLGGGGGVASERAAGSGSSAPAGVQTFSGDGYSLGVPADWRVEQNGKDAVAAYPDKVAVATTSTPTCKIEMSVFPYAPSTNVADWISGRIGADPSIAVVERSSEDVAVNGGTGVKWNGLIDGVPTTLVYAFSDDHAYEIAPSVINETSSGNAQCDDALNTFVSQLTIQ